MTGSRRIVSIDASFGLGEALVSGLVSADLYQVKDEKLVKKQIAQKLVAIYARPAGGTVQQDIPDEVQTKLALTEDLAVKLAGLEFLELYGMRGTGEIDVTRLRWRESPTQLVPAILSHIQSAAPRQHRTDFSAGNKEAERAAQQVHIIQDWRFFGIDNTCNVSQITVQIGIVPV